MALELLLRRRPPTALRPPTVPVLPPSLRPERYPRHDSAGPWTNESRASRTPDSFGVSAWCPNGVAVDRPTRRLAPRDMAWPSPHKPLPGLMRKAGLKERKPVVELNCE